MVVSGEKGKIIAGYFTNWSIYDRKFNVVDLSAQASKLTHILYAFAKLQEDGQVVLSDAYADTDKHFAQNESVDGQDDNQVNQGQNLFGNFKQFYLLKKKHRQLKVSLSIGGATGSSFFPSVAQDADKRQRFVQTSIKLLADLGLDGLDIDWEFPQNEQEATAFVQLLKDVREGLNTYQQQTNQTGFILSVAVPCGADNYNKLKLSDMQQLIDIFYMMAYDYSGEWDSVAGHQAAVFGESVNTDQAIQHYIASGVSPEKLVLGIPVYGRAFSNTDGPSCCYQGMPDGTWERGLFDYKCLPKEGAAEQHDEARLCSWSYDANTREFITYDTPQAVNMKAEYIKSRNLGGAMFWELSADHNGDHPRNLVNAAYQTFGGNIDQSENHLEFPSSQYDNVRNCMN